MTLLLTKASMHFGTGSQLAVNPTRTGGKFLPRTEGEADSPHAAVITSIVCWTS